MTNPGAAAIYVRISSDPSGKALGVERQEEDCRALAARLGWKVAEVYADNDVSAYDRRKRRPQWLRMLDDLAAGKRDGVLVYDLDRVARQPKDLEALIEIVEDRALANAVVTGDIDLSTDNGKFMARLFVNVANKASADTSRRTIRKHEQLVAKGLPNGGERPYGYGALTGAVREDGRPAIDVARVVPEEAEVIREMARRFLAGESFRAIARDLNERGVTTSRGGKWSNVQVRRTITNPRVAGLRAHRKVVVREGTWEPILDRKTWESVCLIAKDASRRTTDGKARKHLLGGLMRCGACGGNVSTGTTPNGPAYRCKEGHIQRKMAFVDEFIIGKIVWRLSMEDAQAALAPDPSGELASLAAEAVALRAKIDALWEAFDGASPLQARKLREKTGALEAEIEALSVRRAELSAQPVLSEFVGAKDVRAKFDALDLETKRTVVQTLMSDMVMHVNGRTGRAVFREDSISFTWRGAPQDVAVAS